MFAGTLCLQRTAIGFLVFLICGCAPRITCGDGADSSAVHRFLFIGNSYTYGNDLPDAVTQLAAAAGRPSVACLSAASGWTLADHASSAQTRELLLSGGWDAVILQEQSEIPAFSGDRESGMYPAVRDLTGRILATGARPVLLLTWAHKDGLQGIGFQMEYDTMQDSLTEGYRGIAEELDIPIAPVGEAWRRVVDRNPGLDLWASDGSHPNARGTYLAACVLFTVLFGDSPVGLAYTGGLSEASAGLLQQAAAETVFPALDEWNLR